MRVWAAAFKLRANRSRTGTVNTGNRVPAGDMDSGTDRRIPAGDMNSGGDVRLWTEIT